MFTAVALPNKDFGGFESHTSEMEFLKFLLYVRFLTKKKNLILLILPNYLPIFLKLNTHIGGGGY